MGLGDCYISIIRLQFYSGICSRHAMSRARRTQVIRREESERKLIEAAVDLVAEFGYDGFTFAQVGERAGYSYGLVPHYFGNKQTLLAEAAENVIHNFGQYRDVIAASDPGIDRIKAIVSVYLDSCDIEVIKTKALHVLLGAALTQERLRQRLQTLTNETIVTIQEEILIGVKQGSVRDAVDAKASSVILAGLLRGSVSLRLIDEGVDLSGAKAEIIRWIDASLGVEESRKRDG